MQHKRRRKFIPKPCEHHAIFIFPGTDRSIGDDSRTHNHLMCFFATCAFLRDMEEAVRKVGGPILQKEQQPEVAMVQLDSIFLLALLIGPGLAGCHSSAGPADSGDLAPGPADQRAAQSDLTGVAGDLPAGNSIAGSVGGMTFDTAASAYRIGSSDDPATTVVYLFSKEVKCAELATPGWDKRINDHTQVLEMKEIGLTQSRYAVTTSPTPGPGEAAVNYTLSSRTGTPVETQASTGSVTLIRVALGTGATGLFDLKFGGSALTGTFDAAFCLEGHEP